MCVYERLADLLEYPDERLFERLDACVAAMNGHRPGTNETPGAELVRRFRAAANTAGVERLQELYAAAFDMDPDCALYAGHHLFGADVRRGVFMACLAAQYREAGIECAPELPDYLPAILRYVDRAPGEASDVRDELLAAVLQPATQKLSEALDRRKHPYALVVHALLVALGAAQAPVSI